MQTVQIRTSKKRKKKTSTHLINYIPFKNGIGWLYKYNDCEENDIKKKKIRKQENTKKKTNANLLINL